MLSGAGADNESMHEEALGEAPQTLPRTRPASAPVRTPQRSSTQRSARLVALSTSTPVVRLVDVSAKSDEQRCKMLQDTVATLRAQVIEAARLEELAKRPKPVPPLRSRSARGSPAAWTGELAEQFITRSKLRMRAGKELDSEIRGELPVASFVVVLERATAWDGTRRALIGRPCGMAGGASPRPTTGHPIVAAPPSASPSAVSTSEEVADVQLDESAGEQKQHEQEQQEQQQLLLLQEEEEEGGEQHRQLPPAQPLIPPLQEQDAHEGIEVLGWISLFGKGDGRDQLIRFDWGRYRKEPRKPLPAPDPPAALVQLAEAPDAAAAAANRASNGAKAKNFLRRLMARSEAKQAQLEAIANSWAKESADGSGNAPAVASGGANLAPAKASKEAKDEARFKPQSSSEVQEAANQLERQIQLEELKLDDSRKGLRVLLGEALMRKVPSRKQTEELVKSWSPKV